MIDLHVHSTCSDGSYTPAGLAELAKETGVEAFALTDHDCIDGNAEAAAAAAKLGVGFINGMEMSLSYQGHKIHVVCLGFDPEHEAFRGLYRRVREVKESFIADVVEIVRKKGIDINMEMVQQHTYAGTKPDRYSIMRTIVEMKLFDRVQYIWDAYLDPAFEEAGGAEDVTAAEALPLIREAGGVTSLAHFHKRIGLKGQSRAEQEDSIKELLSFGLCGMEKYYPNYTAEDAAFAAAMIEKYHMLPTGGTDFHGANRPDILMGSGYKNNLNTPMQFLDDVRAMCRKH